MSAVTEALDRHMPWRMLPNETSKSYRAFSVYLRMPPYERTIRKAYEKGTPPEKIGSTGHEVWGLWSRRHNWVERAAAYDEYLAQQDLIKWEQRREEVKELDFQQGELLRRLSNQILANAEEFVTEKREFIPGDGTKPDREVIKQQIDAQTMLKMIELASKIQRLATGENTDNQGVKLSGEVLDKMLERELEKALESKMLLEDPDMFDAEWDAGVEDGETAEEDPDLDIEIDEDDIEVIEDEWQP